MRRIPAAKKLPTIVVDVNETQKKLSLRRGTGVSTEVVERGVMQRT